MAYRPVLTGVCVISVNEENVPMVLLTTLASATPKYIMFYQFTTRRTFAKNFNIST